MKPNKTRTTSLTVNRDNVIVEVGEDWLTQAEAGGARDQLAVNKVLNRPIGQFAKDDNTRMYIAACLSLCRIKKTTIFRPYRCDSPTHQRYMELELVPYENGQVEMVHYLLKSEPLQKSLNIEDVTELSDQVAALNEGVGYTLRCSMCNSIQLPGTDEWLDPADYVQLECARPHLNVIHTVCNCCKNQAWQIRHPARR